MLEALAGKRQANRLAAAITNIDRVKEAYEVAQNASGSAAAEQERFSQSIQYSLDRLKASGQELAYNLLDSGALKAATELLVSFTNAINAATEATDGLIPVLAGAGFAFYAFNTVTGLTKNLVSGAKVLQGFFEKLTANKIADTIATEANTQAENRNAAAKLKGAAANEAAAAAQAHETMMDSLDNGSDLMQGMIHGGFTPVAEGATEATGATTGLTSALGGLGVAGGVAIGILTAIAATAYMVHQRNEQLKDSAYELASSYKDSVSELNNYKDRIVELQQTINDSSTSYEDARAAREQLLGVQNALIDKYGTEAENVQLVTEAVNGQVEALDKLNEKSWQQTVNDFNKTQGTGFLDFWNHLWHGVNDNVGVMQKEMFEANVKIGGFSFDDKQFLQDMQEAFGGEYTIDMNSGILTLSGDLSTIKEELYEIQRLSKDVKISDSLSNSLTDQINSVEDTLNKYQEMSNQWVLNEDILPNYQKQYQQLIDAHESYEKAVLDGDEKATEQTKENFVKVLQEINKAVANDENKDRILRYFGDMYPDLQAEVGKWRLEATINAKVEVTDDQKKDIYNQLADYSIDGNVDLTTRDLSDTGISTFSNDTGTVAINFTPVLPDGRTLTSEELEAYAKKVIGGAKDEYKLQVGAEFTGTDAINQAVTAANKAHVLQKQYYLGEKNAIDDAIANIQAFSNEYELLNYKEGTGTQEQNDAWLRIQGTIAATNSSLENYIALARESGKLNNFGYADSGVAGAKIGANYQGRTGLNFAEANQPTMDEAINNLNKDDFNDLMSMGDTAMAHIGERAQELAKEMGVTKLETEYWEIIIQSALKEFREIDNTLKTMESPKFDMAGFAGAKEEMANLGTLYKSVKEQMEEDPAKVTVDIGEIEKLREKWAEALGGDEAFDVFEQKLASAATSAEEKISLLEDAATRFADSQFELNGATEETAAMVKSQLTEMGYLESSVDEYINARMRQAAIEREVNSVVEGNTSAIDRVKELLRQEGMELGYTGQELENYINLMMQANGLTITGDASWLATLRNELQLTEKEIEYYLSIAKGLGVNAARNGANGMPTNVMQKASQNNTRQFNVQRSLKFDKDSAAWGSKNKGGGGKSDAEKETDVLAELSKQLDEIQAAYSSLSEIVKSYNENGKLTIDQAQALINTDFRYLAMLTDENGQLKLNEQGFQDLARAKLQEMQIQLAKNAIDTVNGLQSEADAVNFLTYAYEGLKGAALGATEAMLASAVAAAKMRGEQQGIAAEKIQAGYYATKQAIGNIDFGSDSLAGKKDSDKDKSDKDTSSKDKEEKETKTSFNWLDRLINKIQRDIDRLSRRAEKYFSYMEKNALVDKQISANKRMIAAQELSVDYYQNKANKALKQVPKKYRNLVSGNFDPSTVKNLVQEIGEGKTKKLQDYLNWQDLLEKAQDALEDAYAQERELISQKLDNIMDYFDTLNEYQQAILNNLDAQMKADTAKGYSTDINKLLKGYAAERETYQNSGKRDQEYADEADRTIEAIRKSYQEQLDDAQNNIKDTSTYQKLKDKNKKGKINVKQALVGEYQVLAEDAEAAKNWLDKLNKTLDKKGNVKKGKQGKYNEAKAELERLHKKYTDYIADLAKEQQEAIDDAEQKRKTQEEQNKADTTEAYADYWTRLKEILDSVAHVYDLQIEKLEAIINQYDILADTLKDVDDETIRTFGVTDIFGTSNQRSDYLRQSLAESKRQVGLYHQQYDIYAKLIEAAQTKDIKKFESILSNANISSDLKDVVQDLLDQLANDINFDLSNYETTWREGANTIVSTIGQIMKKAQETSDEVADAVTAATQKLIDSLELLQKAYSSRASLIKEDWAVDMNGITEYGYAQIATLAQSINVAQQRVNYAKKQLANLEEEYMNPDSEMTDETYMEKKYAAMEQQMNIENQIMSLQDQINNLAKKAAQNELTQLQKLVDAYKKALNAKKSYYDYDKTLRDKNKNIQNLKSEIAALSNIGDAAAKARLKSLQAELEEAQKDLDDTVFDHSVSIENDALDSLVADLTQQLDDSTKTFREKIDEFNDNVTKLIDKSTEVNAADVYDEVESSVMEKPNLNPTAAITVEDEVREKNKIALEAKQKALTEQSDELDRLQAELATLQSNQRSVERSKTTYTTNRKRRDHLNDLAKQAKTAQSTIDSGFVEIDGVKILASLADTYKSYQKQLSRTKNPQDVGMLKAEMKHIQAESNAKLAEAQSAVNEYTTARDNYNAKVAEYNAKISQYTKDITAKEAEIAEAQSELTTLNNDITELTKKIAESNKILNASPVVQESTGKATVLTSSSPTVADDIASGVLSDLDTSSSQINSQLLSTLAEVQDMKSIVKLDNDFIPTISRNVTLMTADVSNISKNTAAITEQLSTIQKTLDHIDTNGVGNVVITSGMSINDLKQLGLKRTYK